MTASQAYIILAIVVLAIVAALVFLVRKSWKDKRLTPLAGLGFGCIVAGMVFGDNRAIGYGLMGVGVVLAVIDAVVKLKRK
jgi:tellurite resistance protein TehA-like permease